METITQISICEKAIKKWGKTKQIIKAIEELSELTKELTKELNGNGCKGKIQEEIIDVKIMIKQLITIYGNNAKMEEDKMKAIKIKVEND